MPRYKLTVDVSVPFTTIVEADSEKEAIEEALNRETFIPWHGDSEESNWVTDGPWEFPNLPEGQDPEIEEE